jgi:maltose O-acetyltransferase
MNVSSAESPVALQLDPRGVEATSLRARFLARLRGEQTLRRLRQQGLRAQPPIRLAGRTVIDPDFAWAVEIGPHTIIASDVRIIAHDAAIKRLTGYTEVRPVAIGERCYIGTGAIVLPGSVIGDEAIIGAGALVRGEIPARTLAVGTPARVIAGIDELRDRHLAQMKTVPRFDCWPRDLKAAEIDEIHRTLDEHGRVYLF